MQLADYLRNKRVDSYVRGVFGVHSSGEHNMDIFSDLITKLIAEMNNLISRMYMIDYHGLSLRKMFDELTSFTLKIINSNIADRKIKLIDERLHNIQTERSIVDVDRFFFSQTSKIILFMFFFAFQNKQVLLKSKDFANKTLAETQKLIK
jgi:hypothetical protein